MWLGSKQSSRCCGNWPSYNAELCHHLSWEKWGIVQQMCRALLIHNILQNVIMSRCATMHEEGYKPESSSPWPEHRDDDCRSIRRVVGD
jgi:hypothetical protein